MSWFFRDCQGLEATVGNPRVTPSANSSWHKLQRRYGSEGLHPRPAPNGDFTCVSATATQRCWNRTLLLILYGPEQMILNWLISGHLMADTPM